MNHIRAGLIAAFLLSSPGLADVVDFTFAIWSDPHFREPGPYPEGGGAYRDNSAEDIATLEGTAYPPEIGGAVGPIEFVLVPGDITDHTDFFNYQDNDGETNDDFISHINHWFIMPVYEITGNHDSYNEPGATEIRAAIAARHGATSYSFDYLGVHFVGLDGWTGTDGQEFHDSALDYLEAHMPTLTTEQAVIIFNHYPPCDPPHEQWDRVYAAIEGYNVIVLCEGHEHYPRVGEWRGFDYFVTSDCKFHHGNEAFSVVHITDTELMGVAYDWYEDSWRTDALLQKPITGLGPWFSPEVVNPSFEDNGGSLDGWQIIRSDGKGPDDPPHSDGAFGVEPPDDGHFAGKITSGQLMDFSMGQIIQVADYDPDRALVAWSLSAQVHLHCRNDGPPVESFPENIHQAWEVGWNNDGSVPANINGCDTYITVADIDGNDTGNDAENFYPLLASGTITDVTALQYVAFRVRFYNDTGKEWSMCNIDNVSFTATMVPPSPTILLNPQTIEDSVWIGDNPANGLFTVTNIGPGTLNYQIQVDIQEDVDWLSVSADFGESTGESDPIDILYDAPDLSAGEHTATITVISGDAWNSPQTLEVTLTVETVAPDFDGDADVDQEDFGYFQACLTGPGAAQEDPECLDARLDGDEDVDSEDFNIFRGCLSGAEVPANPSCDG